MDGFRMETMSAKTGQKRESKAGAVPAPQRLGPEIPVEEAKKLLREDNRTVVIDTRSEGICRLGHIGGARFIPSDLLVPELERLAVQKDAPVLVYCSFGMRSLFDAERLREKGFQNATSIMGGYSAWLRAGGSVAADSRFTPQQLDRYSRNMLLPEIGKDGQLKLMNAKALLVGAGGLASPAGLYLAACGVGTIGVVDFDRVEVSNLNRQVLHGTGDVGRLKVDSARSAIERINPDVNVVPFPVKLTPENAGSIIGEFDVVLDGTDNVDTKFLLNDACFFAGKPYIFGGAVGFDGQAGVFWPGGGGPCLRCLFPGPSPSHMTATCDSAGVLGMVPGQIGLVQATEAAKLILGIGSPLIGKFFLYNALTLTVEIVKTGRNADCSLCGERPTITSLVGEGSVEYETIPHCRQ
ncbi:MAG: ThiF family adenylyltransferase [Syntrophorhabdales bacterium]|jgi:adenylyltransferase/sulfurtransferase